MNVDKNWKDRIPQINSDELKDHSQPEIDEDDLVLRRSSWETEKNPREEEEEFRALLDQIDD